MAFFLGLDIGTSSVKALLISELGDPIASAIAYYSLSTPRSQWAEQDPRDWWASSITAIRAVVEKAGIDAGEVSGVGLSGQMHGAVFLDSDDRVLRPAILWCDQRTETECAWINEEIGAKHIARYIGNRMLTGFTAPKILWLKRYERELYDRVSKILLPKDYIRLLLTGAYATDVSDASGTALFDVRRRRWSQEMLEALGVPFDWMPDCFESTEITGYITTEAAAATGLAVGTPVVAGAGDQAAGAIGNGIVEPGLISTTIGTRGVVFACSNEPVVDADMRVHTFCHAVPGKWHHMGVVLSAGGSLRWLRDSMFKSCGVDDGEVAYERMTQAAAPIPAGSEGLLFLPYLTGERTPYADADARGLFFGLTLRHGAGHFVRSVMEGVAFAVNDTLRILGDMNVPIEEVRVSGGGAKSQLWLQILADITGYSHIVPGRNEGAAYGAALLATVGVGAYSSVPEACGRIGNTISLSARPRGAMHLNYRPYNDLYQTLYPTLKQHFIALSEIERDKLPFQGEALEGIRELVHA